MVLLWFIMAVVIYPEQMLTALAAVAGTGVLLYTMITKDRTAKEQIRAFLRDEIPEILDLVCTNFLEEYDKKYASLIVNLESQRTKSNTSFFNKMQRYLIHRLEETGPEAKERFKTILSTKDAGAFVHHVF